MEKKAAQARVESVLGMLEATYDNGGDCDNLTEFFEELMLTKRLHLTDIDDCLQSAKYHWENNR